MVNALWALGQRLLAEGCPTPLASLNPCYTYPGLTEIVQDVDHVAVQLSKQVPPEMDPLIVGITGYGNVALGVHEILDRLHATSLTPDELLRLPTNAHGIFRVVFKEENTVALPDGKFELKDYYMHPERYDSIFPAYLDRLTVLMNCIYWEERYPRLVLVDDLRKLYADSMPRLRVIGDLSCDIAGGIEATVRVTKSDDPVYVFDTKTGMTPSGVHGCGPVILAVDNLPAELPKEASEAFSKALVPFIPALANADFTLGLDACGLPPPLHRATIAYRGELTHHYSYLNRFL